MYSLNRWQISSYKSKLALCFIRRLFNKTWNFVTAINCICGQTDELLSSMFSFNSSLLLTQLSESKVESTKPSIHWKSSYSSLCNWIKLDCWNTFVSTPRVKLDNRGFAAEMPKSFSISSQLVLLQCLMWCLNDFCVVNQCLQLGHCLLNWIDMVWISYTILDKLFIHWIYNKVKLREKVDYDKKLMIISVYKMSYSK